MSEMNFSRRAAMFLLPVGTLGVAGGLAGCGGDFSQYRNPHQTDKQFLEMVKGVMPDFRLTPAIIGRPVVRSPGFALSAIRSDYWPENMVQRFVWQFEDTGLRAVTLYVRSSSRSFWRVNFPGCEASRCFSTVEHLNFVSISEREYGRYGPGFRGNEIEQYPVLSAELSGVSYDATAAVRYDYQRRVIHYRVRIKRTAVNEIERRWVANNRTPDVSHPVDIYQYSSNLALGISEFYEDAPVIRTDEVRGL